jgi:Tol biopolymer transport system component
MQLDSAGRLTNLSNGSPGYPFEDHMPDVSSDGSRIAFTGVWPCSDQPERGCGAVVVMNSDGSNKTEILRGSGNPSVSYYAAVWSPDGTRLAFAKQEGNHSYIGLVNADGTSETVLTSGGYEVNPSWSPTKVNGHYRIAYESRTGSAGGQLYIMNDDGSDQHAVASSDTGYNDMAPTWSGDGNRIYFTTFEGAGIWYYSSSNGFASGSAGRSNLSSSGPGTSGEDPESYVRTSADGSLLTYAAADISGCNQIYELTRDGKNPDDPSSGTPRKLTDTGCSYSNYAPTFVPATWPGAESFMVKINNAYDGKVFGSVTGQLVLGDSQVVHPSAVCSSGWEVSTTNNTAFVLHAPTGGNVAGSRIGVGLAGSSYLVPGQKALYCAAFTQVNQEFDVLYDMSAPAAVAGDVAILLADQMGLHGSDSAALSNFVSRVASIPEMQSLGACLGSPNLSCAAHAINALMTNSQSRTELLSALSDYGKDLGQSGLQTWLQSHLRQELGRLFSRLTTGLWVTQFLGQLASPAGAVEFETVPISGGAGGGGGGGGF